MKKLLCFIFLSGASISGSHEAAGALVNLGMVSQLVEIKYHSEAFLSGVLGDAATPKSQKDTAIARYNEIRVQLDRIIYQLCADMRMGNSVRSYNRLNRYYRLHEMGEGEGTGPYILAFKDLYLTYRRSVYREQQGDTKGMITAAALVPIIDTGWTIIKNIRDMSGKKVDGVIELLNNLRLNSPQEVAKGK